MRKQDKIIVWPVYFDSAKTRRDGRRVPKNLAVSSPKISEIKDAVGKIRLNSELVVDAAHPRMPWMKTGMLLVKKRKSKDWTVDEIARQLTKLRNVSTEK